MFPFLLADHHEAFGDLDIVKILTFPKSATRDKSSMVFILGRKGESAAPQAQQPAPRAAQPLGPAGGSDSASGVSPLSPV